MQYERSLGCGGYRPLIRRSLCALDGETLEYYHLDLGKLRLTERNTIDLPHGLPVQNAKGVKRTFRTTSTFQGHPVVVEGDFVTSGNK